MEPDSQRFPSPQWSRADSMLLDMVPNELIGVQLRGKPRLEMKLQPSPERLNVAGDSLGNVCWIPIQYD